jgi:uncharacterized membrane protein
MISLFFLGIQLYVKKFPLNDQFDLLDIYYLGYNLNEKETLILEAILENNGEIMQNEIVKKLNYPAYTVSRSLNSLENKKIIQRKRIGMSKMVTINKNITVM